jgi:hypothetical protein
MTRTDVKSSASTIRMATIPTQIAPVVKSSAIRGSPLYDDADNRASPTIVLVLAGKINWLVASM